MDLATEDILGVEIIRAGGPYHGIGSPSEGDYITTEQLEAAAKTFADLRDEVRAPVKLGHNRAQDWLKGVGDGAPAAGWLDNLRVNGDRLVADLRKVPRKIAALIRAGGYRTRSIEFQLGYTDKSGNRHPFTVTGLALLGAQLPAVTGLDDMLRLYAAPDLTPTQGMQDEAQKGLDWYADGRGGDGLVDSTLDWARRIAAGEALSAERVKTMYAWHARHAVDLEAPKNSNPDDPEYPGPGRVAIALWGGPDAYGWAERKVAALNAEEQGMSRSYMVCESWLDMTDIDRPFDPAEADQRLRAWAGEGEAGDSILRQAYLWWNGTDFRLPIADVVDGTLKFVPQAIFAAATNLESELADVASASDLMLARKMLEELYGRMGRTPPWGADPTEDFSRESEDEYDLGEYAAGQNEKPTDMAHNATSAPSIKEQFPMPELPEELYEALGVASDAEISAVVSRARDLRDKANEVDERAAQLGLDEASVTTIVQAEIEKIDGERFYVSREEWDALSSKADAAGARLFEMEREEILTRALSEQRITPAEVEDWRGWYDANPEMVTHQLSSLPSRDVTGEIGTDSKESPDQTEDMWRALTHYIPSLGKEND